MMMFRIWKEAKASTKDAILLLVAVVGVVSVLLVWWQISVNQPEPLPWRTVMTQDSGIVNGEPIPLIVREKTMEVDTVTYPEPSLLVLQQDHVLSVREVSLVYISPDGLWTEVTVSTRNFDFSRYGNGDPTASFNMLAWRSGATLQSNLDVFLGSINVNRPPLEFDSYVAGRT